MNQIEEFYSAIESQYRYRDFDAYKFFPRENITEDVRSILEMEFAALLPASELNKQVKCAKDHSVAIEYYQRRAQGTTNVGLKTRYYEILLDLKRDNRYAQGLVDSFLKLTDEAVFQEDAYDAYTYLKKSVEMAQKYKTGIDAVKQTLHRYAFDNKNHKLRTKIFWVYNDTDICKGAELAGFANECLSLYEEEPDHNLRRKLLEYAANFSEKAHEYDILKHCHHLLALNYEEEIKPDDEHNIAISHMNEHVLKKMHEHYTLAGEKEKAAKVLRRIELNAKKHKYIHIRVSMDAEQMNDEIEQVNKLVEIYLQKDFNTLMSYLCRDEGCLLLGPEYWLRNGNQKKYWYQELFKPVVQAADGSMYTPDPVMFEKCKKFGMYFDQVFRFIDLLLLNMVRKGALTEDTLISYLQGTGLGHEIEFNRANSTYRCLPLDFVKDGLTEFIRQYRNVDFGQNGNWQLLTDSLSGKFERLLREFVSRKLQKPVTKIKRGGKGDNQVDNREYLPMEDILNALDTEQQSTFDEADKFLFRYTFVRPGLNLRNCIAHGLLLPDEYTRKYALLVVLCILRLSKIDF